MISPILRHFLLVAVPIPAILLCAPVAGADAALDYSYVELRADVARTGNEWTGARGDSESRLAGLTASWNAGRSWFVKAGYSVERSKFSNDVAGTLLELRVKQAVFMAGGGRFWPVADSARLYAEGAVLHSRVDHEHPDVTPVEGGRPTVGKRDSVFEDTGFGAALGVRHTLSRATEIEARLEARAIHDNTVSEIYVAGRRSLTDDLSLGLYASWGETTKQNTGSTARLGVTMRHGF